MPLNYQAAPLLQFIGSAISSIRWLLLVLLLLPRQLLPLLFSRETAERYVAAAESNRVALMGVVFIAGNLINNLLLQSGAFEIYYEKALIWSALERYKQGLPPMPTGAELLEALEWAGAPLVRGRGF